MNELVHSPRPILASIRNWDPSGWGMLAVLRPGFEARPRLIAIRRRPLLKPLDDNHPFWEQFRHEQSILRGGDAGAPKRIDAVGRAVQDRDIEEARFAARKNVWLKERLIAETRELAASVTEDNDVVRKLGKLEHRWSYIDDAWKEIDTDLNRRFQIAQAHVIAAHAGRLHSPATAIDRRRITRAAETLSDTGDWTQLADQFRNLGHGWKFARPSGDDDEPLWQRFQNAYFAARDSGNRYIIGKKVKIIDQLKRLAASTRSDSMLNEAHLLRRRWMTLGPVMEPINVALEQQHQAAWSRIVDAKTRRT
ncbi:MAG: DUF349 domain-containing protein [Cumulibacter sp.]